MPEKTVTLTNPTGLHARPARLFAKAAAGFSADVRVAKDDNEVNAKSTLSVLTLDCHQNDTVTIRTEGDDAENALATLVEMVESNFGEGEAGS